MKNRNFIIYAIVNLVLLAFFPFLGFYFAVITLLLSAQSSFIGKEYMLVGTFNATFCLIITTLSADHFITSGDDYTTYYNNYLAFFSHDSAAAFSQFAGGLEFGVPLMNWIFYIVIGEPLPYLIKLMHVCSLVFLTMLLLIYICCRYRLDKRDLFFLIALSLIFFKLNYLFLMLRQGYASIFIAFALFSHSNKRYLFIIIACCFHISSLVIFPFCYYLVNNRWNLKVFSLLVIFLSLFVYLNISYLSGLEINNFLLVKLKYSILGILDKEMVVSSIVTNLKGVLFFLVPIVYMFFAKKNNHKFKPFLLVVIFVVSMSYLPSLALRAVMPIYAVILGYLYFYSLGRSKQCCNIVMPIIIFVATNTFFSSANFQRFPMFNNIPFYYYSTLFEERIFFIDRFSLPKVNLEANDNKL